MCNSTDHNTELGELCQERDTWQHRAALAEGRLSAAADRVHDRGCTCNDRAGHEAEDGSDYEELVRSALSGEDDDALEDIQAELIATFGFKVPSDGAEAAEGAEDDVELVGRVEATVDGSVWRVEVYSNGDAGRAVHLDVDGAEVAAFSAAGALALYRLLGRALDAAGVNSRDC